MYTVTTPCVVVVTVDQTNVEESETDSFSSGSGPGADVVGLFVVSVSVPTDETTVPDEEVDNKLTFCVSVAVKVSVVVELVESTPASRLRSNSAELEMLL